MSARSWAIDSAGGEPGATGDDEVGRQGHDLLDVDRPERHDVGQRLGLGWVVARIVGGDDAVAGSDGEQCLGHGRRQGHDLLWARLQA